MRVNGVIQRKLALLDDQVLKLDQYLIEIIHSCTCTCDRDSVVIFLG